MPTHEARVLALTWLQTKSPPENALKNAPHIAYYFSLYHQCKALGTLPEAGGFNDQPAAFTAFARVWMNAEAELAPKE